MENLGIDFKLLIAQIFNFLLFFFLFKKFIARPFLKFLQEEKNREIEKEKFEQQKKSEEEKWRQEEIKMRQQLEEEKKRIIKSNQEEMEKMRKEILKKTQEEIRRLKENARSELEKEREIMEKEILKKAIDLSIAIVETSLKNYLTAPMRKEITQAVLKNLEKEN